MIDRYTTGLPVSSRCRGFILIYRSSCRVALCLRHGSMAEFAKFTAFNLKAGGSGSSWSSCASCSLGSPADCSAFGGCTLSYPHHCLDACGASRGRLHQVDDSTPCSSMRTRAAGRPNVNAPCDLGLQCIGVAHSRYSAILSVRGWSQ